ncbi:hypothetical protein A1OO_18730 [Enterovibrio norvegicus FF-33]|uniref:Uncharacterized protein n=1 Tax=Enterovibrio norvegicus FF-454 TaxID=1185651 RepID=A0A1E5C0L6_9GAMM|nr:hypothetical protein A1OK_03405 [Enterovibrio norvegicus FF-454]OEE67774.1 hypothetical protein A1OO_18730 [Enterovibrio norvegicus FF-33]OEE74770.1 hypothetical protein A1OQ_08480 [Enterovibrio norvegicus FF-162]
MQHTRNKNRSLKQSRLWALANIRRQHKKKVARTRTRRNCEFYNLQMSGVPVELSNISTEEIKETNHDEA